MRTKKEIQDKIDLLMPYLELARESYFSAVEDKQKGKEMSQLDFLKIESEFELLEKELESLEWVLNEE